MPILMMSSSSEAHLTPLGGRKPGPIENLIKKRPQEARLLRGRKTYNWKIYGLNNLDQLTLTQTQMAGLISPEFLIQEFAPLTSSRVDAVPPGTPL